MRSNCRRSAISTVRGDGGGVDAGEALRHLRRSAQDALAVAAPLLLAAVERGAAADRDERVLEQRAPRRMGMDVAGGDGVDAEVCGEILEGGVAPHVAALERPLQLDEEAVAAEGAGETGGGVRIAHGEAVAGAAGEADEPLRMLLDEAPGRRTGAAARDPPGPPGGCLRAPR